MKTSKELHEEIKALGRQIKLPANRRFYGPLHARKLYRGKERYIVGYCWNRPYSHYASGLVYDCVMGYGETYDEAIAMMKKKITSTRGK